MADALATLAAADPHSPWLVVAGATDVFVALHRRAHQGAAALDASPPRIAIGGVGPTVCRLTETERALAAGASVDDVVRAMHAEIEPIDEIGRAHV